MTFKVIANLLPCVVRTLTIRSATGRTTSLAMRLTAVLLITFTLQGSARGTAQTITVSFNNTRFETVLKNLKKQTDYTFIANAGLLDKAKNVTVKLNNASIEEVLNACFKGQPFMYSIDGKIISIIAPTPGLNSGLKEPQFSAALPPPPITVRGRILNEKGEPVVASVIIKGTNKGTTTDGEGNFVLENVDEKAVLVVSGINIESLEVRINRRAELNISAITKVASEDEVTVSTGYWTTSKKLSTGNIGKVTSKEIEKQPVSNPLAALQARVPGLEITQNNGVPGGNFTVRIRGINSIGSGNDPLYIVDGVPFTSGTLAMPETSGELLSTGISPLNYINASDIESIEVLKDASATAVYGSRGANGIILITTKKGRAGKSLVNLNYYTGFSKVENFVDLLKTTDYLEMRKEGFVNDGYQSLLEDPAYDIYWPDVTLWSQTKYTDWQKVLIGGTAHTNDAQVNFSGGENFTQFSIGAGFHKETTVFPGKNEDQRISSHLSITNTSPNRKLKTSASINYSNVNSNLLGGDLTSLSLSLAPNAPDLYDSIGNLNWENQTWTNPLNYLLKNYEAKTNNLIANATVNYNVLPGLILRANAGYTNVSMRGTTITPNRYYGPPVVAQAFQHASAFANTNFQNWIIEPQINYKRQMRLVTIDLLAGTSFLEQVSEGGTILGKGFASEALIKNIGAATDRSSGNNYYSQYKYNAFFARINFSVKDKYILDLTGRRDGSSRFGPSKQFANFGAIGLSWLFVDENFIRKDLSFFSFGKLRASYGTAGNDQIGDYQYLNVYTSGPLYMGNPSLRPSQLFNANFAWEVNKKFEAALEFGMLKDRITGTFSFYRNRSSSQLIGYSLPPTTGFPSILSNFPALVQNKGLEISLITQNIKKKNLTWTTNFNFTRPRNKLVDFPNLESSTIYASKLVIGQPLSIQKVFHYKGINSETGAYQILDVDSNGLYNQADRQIVSFVGSKYYAGLTNNLTYKGFQLDCTFQFVKQMGFAFNPGAPGGQTNQHISVMNRWQKPGDITESQKFTAVYSDAAEIYGAYSNSDRLINDISYVRLKNLSISYSLPHFLIDRAKITGAKVFLNGQNLLTITDYIGLDPESQGTALPPLKTLTFGFNIIL